MDGTQGGGSKDSKGSPASKVLFRVPDDEGGYDVEVLWAVPLGDDRYQLDNSPFYAYDVSWQDTVVARFDDDEGFPTFESVAVKSGNRTVRVRFDVPIASGNASDSVVQGLVALGCRFEGANAIYLSVIVPTAVDLQDVCAYLIDHDVEWEHADPSYASLYPDDV